MYQGKYYSTTFNLCACRVRMTELNTLVTCSRHTAWWRNKTWLIDIWSPYIRQSTWKVHRIMSWSRTLTRNLKNFRAETCILKTMWEKMQALYFVKGGIHRTLKIGLKCYDSHKAQMMSHLLFLCMKLLITGICNSSAYVYTSHCRYLLLNYGKWQLKLRLFKVLCGISIIPVQETFNL